MDALLLKAAAKGREAQEKQQQERRRSVLVLILRHLLDNGYIEAYERLAIESNLSLSKVDVADNVDLLRIVQEYEEYQELQYDRKPKLVRKVTTQGGAGVGEVGQLPDEKQPIATTGQAVTSIPYSGQLAVQQRREKGAAATATAKEVSSNRTQPITKQRSIGKPTSLPSKANNSTTNADSSNVAADSAKCDGGCSMAEGGAGMQISGQSCLTTAPDATTACRGPNKHSQINSSGTSSDDERESDSFYARRLLKPLPTSLLGELRELGSAITRDIYLDSPNVHWGDIAGLEEAKRLLKESVVLPMKYPHLFTGLLAPWRGVLLYGPPGTGKTLLAKAVATQCKTTFFNISASSIISKWRGDSEKLVRVLFDLAHYHAPSTIFLDEIDALMGARGAAGEHEASRRMKTELLIQMDGLARSSRASGTGGEPQPQVFVLCATNLPWELDTALLRHLEKRILVPLPDSAARRAMLESLLGSRAAPDLDLDKLAVLTEGYSGSDMTVFCKEAAMRPLRRLMAVLEPTVYGGKELGNILCDHSTAASAVGSSSSALRRAAETGSLDPAELAASVQLRPVTPEDAEAALAVTKPSAQAQQQLYLDFHKTYGQTL